MKYEKYIRTINQTTVFKVNKYQLCKQRQDHKIIFLNITTTSTTGSVFLKQYLHVNIFIKKDNILKHSVLFTKAFTYISPYRLLIRKKNQIHSILISKMPLAAEANLFKMNWQQELNKLMDVK